MTTIETGIPIPESAYTSEAAILQNLGQLRVGESFVAMCWNSSDIRVLARLCFPRIFVAAGVENSLGSRVWRIQ